jgi:hypothetical protein
MRSTLAILPLILLSNSAFAQGTDKYWQQFVASKEAQCAQQIVALAKALDDEKEKTAALQKQLDELRKSAK